MKISLDIPADLAGPLDSLAGDTRLSRAALLRLAVAGFLAGPTPEALLAAEGGVTPALRALLAADAARRETEARCLAAGSAAAPCGHGREPPRIPPAGAGPRTFPHGAAPAAPRDAVRKGRPSPRGESDPHRGDRP